MSLVNSNPLILAAGGDYQISRSVRLRSSASAYFNRTPASAGNRTTWTWSGWVKRGALATAYITSAQANGNAGTSRFNIYFNSDSLNVEEVTINTAAQISVATTQVFRDPSAWYHIVVAMDTTQATASNRIKIYVNGSQVTAFSSTTYPTQNFTTAYNNNVANYHGYSNNLGTIGYADHYLTEINFIDGQALTPSSFGETNPVTGVWQPKKYTGTYGTNGFYLNFSDNSAATAAAIGKDSSGNGNNWTPNNISVTSGTTYDSMLDVPTLWADGGNGRGNYAVLNPISKSSAATISSGNLAVTTSTSNQAVGGTIAVNSGKYYFEAVAGTATSGNLFFGIATIDFDETRYAGGAYVLYNSDGTKFITSTTAYGASYAQGDTLACALDCDSGTVTFYKNGTSQGAITGVSMSVPWKVSLQNTVTISTAWNFNFGQRPFSYTPPTGFKALNTGNLPEPTIVNGSKWMDATLYTGTGSALSITNSGSMQPDWVWIKNRSSASSHILVDSVRGVANVLTAQATSAEQSLPSYVTALNSNGFSVGTGSGGAAVDINQSGQSYVGWQWRANGTPAVTNTAGSITSTVSASTTSGFSVVTYTGNGSSGSTIGHGLGVAPRMIIVKSRSSVTNWRVGHSSLPSWTNFLQLDGTNAQGSNNVIFNGTAPTSTVFTVGNDSSVNSNGSTYVAYCFAPVAGFSAFGSYTGNGSSDGVFVYTGFRPKFVLYKRTDTTENWYIQDGSRSPYNAMKENLFPNLSISEISSANYDLDFTANGFKFRNSSPGQNASGGTYIFAAFAENPTKFALAR